MSIKDIFNSSKIKAENERLSSLMTPELQEAGNLLKKIEELTEESNSLEKALASKRKVLSELEQKEATLKNNLIIFNDDMLVQEFGLYQPRYSFNTSDEYKEALTSIRTKQKSCIKEDKAVTGNYNFTYNNSKSQGNKMVKDMQKLLLRAFNSECDETISNVKYNNFDMSLKKIVSSASAISKLGTMLSIKITNEYFELKKQELILAFEYQQKKQEEKEALKEARAEQREQAKLQKEIEEQRKKLEKEQTHYQTAILKLKKQLEASPDDTELTSKYAEIENHLNDIEKAIADVDYRQANIKAGYVYIISNIGAFGENVYKIGMTRRLEPQERVDELGDASVPFNFDVHAMIFSDDAPALEAALHRAFEDKKINMVNHRREFFRVTLDEIKAVIKENFDKTVEYKDVPDAEQYRISLKMHENIN